MSETVRGRLVWAAWLALLGVWTYALLSPRAGSAAGQLLPTGMRFYAAKCLHLAAYAFLTFLAAWLPPGGRWAAWLGLLLHAGLTEWLQSLIGRDGSVRDVLVNCAGIALGLCAAFWLRLPARDGGVGGPGVEPQPHQ